MNRKLLSNFSENVSHHMAFLQEECVKISSRSGKSVTETRTRVKHFTLYPLERGIITNKVQTSHPLSEGIVKNHDMLNCLEDLR